jgi:magnesium transporter
VVANVSRRRKDIVLLKAYGIRAGELTPVADAPDPAKLAGAKWIDLWDPSPEEIAAVERLTSAKISLPEGADRFYVSDQVESSNGQLTLKALLLASVDQHRPTLIPVTFIRTAAKMITISKGSPNGLSWLVAECQHCLSDTTEDILPAMLDMVVDHATNILDQIGADLDRTNRKLFQHRAHANRRLLVFSSPRHRTRQLEAILIELGYLREVLVKQRRSVVSFRRLIGLLEERRKEDGLAETLRAFEHELQAIVEAQADLSNSATFMLDGAVGFITILQSKTINIMTIVGILLTPPVLIASIYGMNFEFMPELKWEWGYAWALALMVVSTLAVFLIVRLRGWL